MVPLYKISCYRDDFFRVVKRRCGFSGPVRIKDTAEYQEYDCKLDNALCRARTVVREYALCNNWEWFGTLTFSRANVADRYDLARLCQVLMQWLQNMRKRYYPKLKYLLVPEQHKDGAWHFHGFFSGVPMSELPPFAPRDLLEEGYLEWTDFRLRFGWCSFGVVKSAVASAFYVTKYITKSLANAACMKGVHTHYQSRGLLRSLSVGSLFGESLRLDRCCKCHNSFCSTGFFRLKDVGASDFGDLVDMCDEVDDMYQSYVSNDPETKLPLVLMGGDTDDESFQMVLDFFQNPAVDLSGRHPWDFFESPRPRRRG